VSVYEREREFRDSYLKSLIELEFQERDKSKINSLFPNKFHSFYGNLVFFDEIVTDPESISIDQLLSVKPELEHNYVLFLKGEYNSKEDKEKIVQLILYLKNMEVKVADIDIAYFDNEPAKSAIKTPFLYVGNKDVNQVISIQPKTFQRINNIKEFEDIISSASGGKL
jgi:hypothetical protein